MRPAKAVLVAMACALAFGASIPAEAQRGGGGGLRGGGGGGNPGGANPGGGGNPLGGGLPGNGSSWWNGTEGAVPTWAADLKSALGQQKPVLVYVRPPDEIDLPGCFRHPDIARASRDTAVFVRMPMKSSDPFLKEMNVRTAPAILILDTHGNPWKYVTSNLSQSTVAVTLRAASEEISRYVEWLDKSIEQGQAREGKDDRERGALFHYRKVAAEKRKGYEQIAAAREKVRELSEGLLRAALAQLATDEKEGLEALSAIARDFNGTSVGARAQLARLKVVVEQAGDLRMTIPEVQRLAEMDGEDLAAAAKGGQELLGQIEGYGAALVAHAQRKARRGDAEAARTLLRQIAVDFPGTKAARQANDELAKL